MYVVLTRALVQNVWIQQRDNKKWCDVNVSLSRRCDPQHTFTVSASVMSFCSETPVWCPAAVKDTCVPACVSCLTSTVHIQETQMLLKHREILLTGVHTEEPTASALHPSEFKKQQKGFCIGSALGLWSPPATSHLWKILSRAKDFLWKSVVCLTLYNHRREFESYFNRIHFGGFKTNVRMFHPFLRLLFSSKE